MVKQITQFKCIIDGIESIFHFEANCPCNIAKEALFEGLKWIGQIEDAAKAQAEANKPIEENPEEQPKEEVACVDQH